MVGGLFGPMTGAAVGIAMYALLDQQFGLSSIAFKQAESASRNENTLG